MSVQFGIQVTGTAENIAALAAISEGAVDELPDTVQQAAFPAYYALANYDAPAVPTYTRTYQMQQSVYAIVHAEGPQAAVEIGGNQELYWTRGTPDGNYGGAWMHLGRWRTFKDIVDTLIPVAVAKVQQALDALIARVWR